MQTSFGNAVDIGARTDALAKNLVSHKIFLAKLMKECVPEFAGHDPAFIAAQCIEGNPEISSIPVNRDELANTRITGMNSEDSSATEQTIRFDIRFRAVVPGTGGVIMLILNVEIQAKERPGNPLSRRGIYYCSRMISAQYGTEFTKQHYNDIKKVYSIWICPASSASQKSGIVSYGIRELERVGEFGYSFIDYDLLQVIIIHLGTENEENELIGFLNTLFDNSTTAETRKAIMESKYHIAITEDIEKEMSEMCNLSQSIEQRGIEIGEQRGIEIGEQRGIEIGEQRTLIEALKALISNMGLTKERAMEVLNIPEDQKEKLSSLI